MAAWGAAREQNTSADGMAAAMPVTFAGTIGLFMPAKGRSSSTAILFLSPWGFEEMCTRKFWRILAEDFAAAGIASLRFDYIGTGDALDTAEENPGLEPWDTTALAAADTLKSLSGCKRLILVSQGLGAAVAVDIAGLLPSVDGIAFLAPVLSGRAYLRELGIWSKMIDESMGLAEGQRQTEGISVAGLKLADPIADSVRKLNLAAIAEAPAPACLVLTRPGRPSDAEFASRLESLGARVEQAAYDGYDDLVSNPTVATMPLGTGQTILRWVKSIVGDAGRGPSNKIAAPCAKPLVGDGFRETPLRLGKDNGLFGILCEPTGPRTGATAVLLTTAYDRHAGWGRTSVTMARSLARDGIPSLRFDTANVADSPPRAGAPAQVLYSDSQQADVHDAFDLIEAHELLPAFVVGRCSGGYLAFRGTVHEKRCSGVVSVNPYTFRWDETQSVEEALRFVPRSLEAYGQKLLQFETLKRLYAGSIDAKSAVRNMLTSVLRRVARLRRPFLDVFPFLCSDRTAVIRSFQTLAKRKAELSLIYSAHDIGLEHFRLHFGQDGAGLKAFPNVRLTIIPDADHNLTPTHARDIYFGEIRDMALRLGKRQPAVASEQASSPVRSRKYAGCPAR